MLRNSSGSDSYEKMLAQLRVPTKLSLEDLKIILGTPDINWNDEQLNEIYLTAVKNNYEAISIIPLDKLIVPGQHKFKDEITFALLEQDFEAGMHFINELFREGGNINSFGYKTISLIVEHYGLALENVDTSTFTSEQRKALYGKALKGNPDAVNFIPENDRVDIYLQELKKDWRVLKVLYESMLKQNNEALNKVIKEVIEECKKDIKKDWQEIKYIPAILLDHDDELLKVVDEACRQGIQTEWWQLNIIPEKIIDNDIDLLAVNADAEALQYIPVQRRTYNVCLAAVLNDTDAMRWIKDPNNRPALTKDEYLALCQSAIAKNKEALNWVHKKVKNELNIADISEKTEITLNLDEKDKAYSEEKSLKKNFDKSENKKNELSTTVVISLDINETDPNYNSWKSLSAREKVDKIIERIDKTCEALKNNNPNARWIIGFREYAITEKNSRHINDETRKYFKEKMAKITEKYRDNELTILGGTISTQKPYDLDNAKDREHVKRAVGYYRQPSHFEVIEQERNDFVANRGGMAAHEASAAEKLRLNVKKGYIIRNTMYCFTDGKLLGAPYDKMTPWFELSDMKSGLFQTQNKKGNLGYYEVGNISFGVDICRGHSFSVFKKMCLAKNIKMPDFHFLISDDHKLVGESIYGEYAIHMDSRNPTRLVCCLNDKSELHTPINSVSLYTVNMSSNEFEIKGPFPAEQNVKELEIDTPAWGMSEKKT